MPVEKRIEIAVGGDSVSVDSQVTSGDGSITLASVDQASAGQDLTVSSGITVQSTGGNVTLQAGDNLSILAGATVGAGGAVTLAVDVGDAVRSPTST